MGQQFSSELMLTDEMEGLFGDKNRRKLAYVRSLIGFLPVILGNMIGVYANFWSFEAALWNIGMTFGIVVLLGLLFVIWRYLDYSDSPIVYTFDKFGFRFHYQRQPYIPRKIQEPKPWIHTEQITQAKLEEMRASFWETCKYGGGDEEVWNLLKLAAESGVETAQTLLLGAKIIVYSHDLSICYDKRGFRYELPNYVISEPIHMIT